MEVMRSIGSRDHLPLYYTLMLGWARLFGPSEIGLRSFSAVVGGLSVIPMFLLGRRYSLKHGGLAGLMIALLPVHVYFGQEAKMYALIIFLTGVSLFSMIEYLDTRIFRTRKVPAVMLLFVNILLAYTHYYAYLFLICEFVYVLYALIRKNGWKDWKKVSLRMWPLVFAPLTGIFWFIFLVRQDFLSGMTTGGGIELDIPSILSIYPFLMGSYVVPDGMKYVPLQLVTFILFCCFYWGTVYGKKKDSSTPYISFALIFLILPTAMSLILSKTVMNIFGQRYFLIIAVVPIILAARPVKGRSWERIKNGLIVSLVLLSVIALPVQYFTSDKDDWRSAVSCIEDGLMEDDVVVPAPYWEYRSIDYYNSDLKVIISPDEDDLDEKLNGTDRVWVVVKASRHGRWVLRYFEDGDWEEAQMDSYKALDVYLFRRSDPSP
jgi:hypothetical protein